MHERPSTVSTPHTVHTALDIISQVTRSAKYGINTLFYCCFWKYNSMPTIPVLMFVLDIMVCKRYSSKVPFSNWIRMP